MAYDRRASRLARPTLEGLEDRWLLTQIPGLRPAAIRPLAMPGFAHPVRPNTPVLPYGAPFSAATFIDPSVHIVEGQRAVVGQRTYIAPYANLDARAGFLKVGNLSYLQDNASLVANPGRQPGLVGVTVGDSTVIAYNAVVGGPAQIGAFGTESQPTYVGPNAVIDGAIIEPGAYVSGRARVGPGITIASGLKVLPGAQVTTQAEASDPALGKVAAVTEADLGFVRNTLADSAELTVGYATLYQGRSVTGRSPGTNDPTIFNGDLSQVSGTSPQPGKPAVSFEPARSSPRFPSPNRGPVQANLASFRGRVIGGVVFGQRAGDVAHRLGHGVSIRGDVGQPITIGSINRIGDNVAVHAPRGGKLTIGQNFTADARATIIGGKNAVIGNDVRVGAGAVVENAQIGNGASIGAGALIRNAVIPAGAVIPANAVILG